MLAVMNNLIIRNLPARRTRSTLLLLGLSWLVATVVADVPTERQQCEMRNLAVCEFGTSGVQSSQPGPCPDGSRTIKPAGAEDCATVNPPTRILMPSTRGAQPASPQHTDLSYVGATERWLIPALIYTTAGAVALYAWILIRRRLKGGFGGSGQRGGALPALISIVFAALCGWMAAKAAFGFAFNSFDNHDSAAPLLLAAPVWLLTFGIVAVLVFAILMLGWKWLRPDRRDL